MKGRIVISLAGHDQGNLYYVIDVNDSDVWVADGKYRTVSKPKKKNRKHIQVLESDGYLLNMDDIVSQSRIDEKIKRNIREWKIRNKNIGGNGCQKPM